jgi:hypothetical protein
MLRCTSVCVGCVSCPYTQALLTAFASKNMTVETFRDDELLIDITEHELVSTGSLNTVVWFFNLSFTVLCA